MNFSHKHEHLDTDLNIVPIIDCFVMLICFLLFTAAFTQLVYLETKLTTNTSLAASKSRSEFDQFRLVISLEEAGVNLKTTGSNSRGEHIFIPKINSGYDFKKLHESIVQIKIQNPDRFSADLEVKNKNSTSINYETILATIDAVRHLNDQEYTELRSTKLNDKDAKPVGENIKLLAESLNSKKSAPDTDPKLLFPDIAVLGIE